MVLSTTSNEDIPFSTHLKPDAWSRLLEEAGILQEFKGVPEGLREGFHIGVDGYRVEYTFIPPNHFRTETEADIIRAKFKEEISLGRISAGMSPEDAQQLLGNFRTAPMAVLEQRPGKFRIIINHSYPKLNFTSPPPHFTAPPTEIAKSIKVIDPAKISINSLIDSDDFPCDWGTFANCYLLVADAPEGTQVAIFDVDAAFRNIPIHPSVRHLVCLFLDGLIHLDLMLNFGECSAPGIWGHVADAMVKILLHRGVEALLKWVDDFIFFRYPKTRTSTGSFTYSYDESLIWDTAEILGWPWAPKKFVPFAHFFTYIGFLWKLDLKTVELLVDKKSKYRSKLAPWLSEEKLVKDKADSIIGTLNHVCLVAPEGRSRLIHFYRFRASFKDSTSTLIKHRIPNDLRTDILWWDQLLQQDFVGIKIKRPPEFSDNVIFVDASTCWGIGLILNGKWLAWELREGWRDDEGRHIGWAEMVAIELAIRTLISTGRSGLRIRIYSDNKGVVGALHRGCSRGPQQNLILRKIVELMQKHNIWVEPKWVSTHDNIADAPSRAHFPPRALLHPHPPAIPSHLKLFVHNSVSFHDPCLIPT
ncbi:reverse transcriptase ribonuclease [Lentinula edodes]|uniref:Reverse transcriptase ribonuclease n=1 Tax=Lentinula edodes TaxID=5353 RepID=A0A1Q3E797_LENED|nr:reverse transcriptase ribonuclease [Lentinula edodes]